MAKNGNFKICWSSVAVRNAKKSPGEETGLGNRGRLKVLNTKLSIEVNLVSVKNLRLLHFVAFFHVASLFSTGVENKKVGVDNKKAL